MSAQPLAIVGTGSVTGVGLSAPASFAAIRCAIDGFRETGFLDAGGEWVIGCEAALERPCRGTERLVEMLARSLRECAGAAGPTVDLAAAPILLCLAEAERPGRPDDLAEQVSTRLAGLLGIGLHEGSAVIEQGRVGTAIALQHARRLIYADGLRHVIVAAADSLLSGPALSAYEARDRLLTSLNSDGFVPGEAAAAFVVSAPRHGDEPRLLCEGIGFGLEPATEDAGEPLRAEGLAAAIRAAFVDAGRDPGDMDFRVADVSGGQYRFKEAALAIARILRSPRPELDLWHPADCIGEVGAAAGAIIVCLVQAACAKSYAKGRHVLIHFGNDDARRAAAVFSWQESKDGQ